ncbi:hypothetical protein O7634_22290 [Micromonospora sp. WMMD1120]|uniref:hypothetical protein n=1 Tax=Micromonospora sp. WMMD1120 TaxID=3016106 RepID=UPI00241748DF|nr:hypothetical protein [Micromonospora sp. WMMD1120]MDG4809486.1 hypothetical protein [Micromonospora sp. WMMD1120]
MSKVAKVAVIVLLVLVVPLVYSLMTDRSYWSALFVAVVVAVGVFLPDYARRGQREARRKRGAGTGSS